MNPLRWLLQRRVTPRAWAAAAALTAFAALAAAGVVGHHPGHAGTTSPHTVTMLPAPPSSASPDDDDGTDNSTAAAPAPPSPSPVDRYHGAADAAVEFLARFLNTYNKPATVWRASWMALLTPTEAQAAADIDPANVPVGRVGTPTTVTPLGSDQQVVVSVPIVANTGTPPATITTAKVTMLWDGHRWLVNQLDRVNP